jgi:hypothetical protein
MLGVPPPKKTVVARLPASEVPAISRSSAARYGSRAPAASGRETKSQ